MKTRIVFPHRAIWQLIVKMLLCTTLISIISFNYVIAQKPSPCPDIFVYEQGSGEDNRWYGRLSISSDSALTGLWVRLQLDEPAEALGNWFGDTSSTDNKEFLIKNREYKLDTNREPLSIRVYVKYNPARPVPSLIGVRLNGKTICSATTLDNVTTKKPQLFLSNTRVTSSDREATTVSSDEDFFPGDFSQSKQRPVVPTFKSNSGDTCGRVKMSASPLITYGEATIEGQWPWHAALYRSKGVNLEYICGGTLISPSHVLTAAHCVTRLKTGVAINPDLFAVHLGKYHMYRLGQGVQDKAVAKITTHPEFNATFFYNDIALLRLETPIEINDFVRYVCLWEEDASLNSVMERLGTVVGWGYDQNGNITENLMQAKMPIVSTETCIFSNRDFFSRFTSTTTFCAGYRNGTSACTGDSGGGMVFTKTGTQGENAVWQLRGVISLSAVLQNEDVVCDTSNYIIFTDVAKHLNWIRNEMNKN